MAGKGLIANLRPFKPGQSGNPAGRNGTLPPEIRSERKRNQGALIRTITSFFTMRNEEAEKRIMAAETTQLEAAVFAIIGKAKEGDVNAFKYLSEIMTGKIPEHDNDGFTEDDLRILNRVKEFLSERQAKDPVGSGD